LHLYWANSTVGITGRRFGPYIDLTPFMVSTCGFRHDPEGSRAELIRYVEEMA
jgi:hypothetical protein